MAIAGGLLVRPSGRAGRRAGARREDRLTAPDAAVTRLPGPAAAVISVHQLERPYPGPVQLAGDLQVRQGLGVTSTTSITGPPTSGICSPGRGAAACST